MRYVPLIGRILFSAIFILSAPNHFTASGIGFAAAKGVPLASLLVPLSGILLIVGGLSVLLGYRARRGAWMIVLFLVPVTLTMHDFWNIVEPQERMVQRIMFMKNLAMLGGALLIATFGTGPLSLKDERRERQLRSTRGEREPALR